jgi:hypothetical protein
MIKEELLMKKVSATKTNSRKVSGYYKRLVPGTNMTFRDWLAYKGFSYEQQTQIGEYILEMYGIKVK